MYNIGLYPPIFSQSYMPAFIISQKSKIYFQISALNALDELYHTSNTYNAIQVIVKKQKDNRNVLISSYRNEIFLTSLNIDETREGNDKYYIEIPNSYIEGGFKLNEYYKVQIRFTGKDAEAPPAATNSSFGNWLSNNVEFFSQWSSVVLIRGISSPSITLKVNNSTASEISVSTDYIQIDGSISFSNGDNEKLESYRIKLYKNNNLQEDSEEIYSKNNKINYNIETSLELNVSYRLEVIIFTNNGYTRTITRTITRTGSEMNNTFLDFQQEVNNQAGYIKIVLEKNKAYAESHSSSIHEYYILQEDTDDIYSLVAYSSVAQAVDNTSVAFQSKTIDYRVNILTGIYYNEYTSNLLNTGDQIIIRRTGSDSNFKKWNSMADFSIPRNDLVNVFWYDYTAEPGIWYKYQVLRYNNAGTALASITTNNEAPVMLDTDDIFLNAQGQQLIIKFDPIISNISNKVAESVVDTIGSKYPFIRRNGAVNYRTFSLSGTISYFMDIDWNTFHGSKQELYGETLKFYENYNSENNINLYNDIIYEKHFRKKVIDFLESRSIKLLRSTTEGNILVKLSNVNLTPNQTLGRRIYSFNCTAYEINQCNVKNYNKYNILTNNIKMITKQEAKA